jgi:tetratricopeptide (TPR) repeat protein
MSINNTHQVADQLKKSLQAHQGGDLKEAQLLYKKILAIDPGHFDALQLLATSYAQQKESLLALDYFEKALSIDSSKAFLFNNLGNVLKSLERYDEALIRYGQAIDLKPDYAEAYHNRANTQKAQGHFNTALKDYEQAIQLKPDYHEAYHYRALVYKELFKYEEAKLSLVAAINIQPNYVEAIYTLGIIYRCQNQFAEAVKHLELACSKRPHYADAWVELANTYIDVGRTDLAIQGFDRALAIDPQYPFLRGLRQYYRMQLCEWSNFSEELTIIKNEIEQGLPVCTPFPSHALLDCPSLQRKCAEIYAGKLLPVASPKSEFPPIRQSPSKIRIAYFSSDFGNHPVTHLLVRLFELHSRDRFEVFGFSLFYRPPDEWKKRVESSFDHFFDVHVFQHTANCFSSNSS